MWWLPGRDQRQARHHVVAVARLADLDGAAARPAGWANAAVKCSGMCCTMTMPGRRRAGAPARLGSPRCRRWRRRWRGPCAWSAEQVRPARRRGSGAAPAGAAAARDACARRPTRIGVHQRLGDVLDRVRRRRACRRTSTAPSSSACMAVLAVPGRQRADARSPASGGTSSAWPGTSARPSAASRGPASRTSGLQLDDLVPRDVGIRRRCRPPRCRRSGPAPRESTCRTTAESSTTSTRIMPSPRSARAGPRGAGSSFSRTRHIPRSSASPQLAAQRARPDGPRGPGPAPGR